ncbi:MAG: DNA-protecting protein DprA [Cohaesibacteraceae bacterium]|nr:DNA-protecting protein DprA [Cohaesibacteraceae bacterium]
MTASITSKVDELPEREKFNRLRLIRSENVGPVTYHSLIRFFGSVSSALDRANELAARGGSKRSIVLTSVESVELEWEKTIQLGAKFVAEGETSYPDLLGHLHDQPPVLTIMGNTDVFQKDIIGIIGSRNASVAGKTLTQRFASELGDLGFAIASGLARGIDTCAHVASLKHGTVAVFAGGIDIIYPPENRKLTTDITSSGVLFTEMPLGWKPRARDFPRRNRLVSGISKSVIVIEAAKRSGSLITARLAMEQNRDVFAVPGSPLDPRAEGTNQLIKNGAYLALDATEIADITSGEKMIRDSLQKSLFETSDAYIPSEWEPIDDIPNNDRDKIVNALGPTPVLIDMIVRMTEVDLASVQLALIELDLAGRLERHAGGRVSLV